VKDNFSDNAADYATYRPQYPPELYEFIYDHVPATRAAWDCGTGNGQIALELAKHFDRVYATDISAAQIAHAQQKENISYSVQPAEQTDFPDGIFDLITTGQAIHWFDFDRFYATVKRTAGKGALLCVTGYGNLILPPGLQEIVVNFYERVTGPYWDVERRYIDEDYKSIPFPFRELEAPQLVNKLQWNRAQLTGYISTWSGLRHFIKQKGYNPLEELSSQLDAAWPTSDHIAAQFPILLRAGYVA